MSILQIELPEQIMSLLRDSDQSVEAAARELIIWELYRRHEISRGRAAELLNLDLLTFIQRASGLGIPYIDMTEEEWAREMELIDSLYPSSRLSPTPVP